MIKVSIIIPVYNVEKYIERCLRSVISQTYSSIECIIVNDGTPDRSFEIAKNFVNKYNRKGKSNVDFILVEHDHNKGLSEARNTGVKASTGEYVYFLDSDDAIPDNAIKDLVQVTEKKDKPDIVYGHTLALDSMGNAKPFESKDILPTMTSNKDILKGNLYDKWPRIACNKLIKKSIFTVLGIWFYPNILHEDELWTFEVSTAIETMFFCPKITYIYYVGDNNSISRRPPIERDFKDNITILEIKASYLDKVSCQEELANNIYDLSFILYYSLVRLHFPKEFRKECRKRLYKIIKYLTEKMNTTHLSTKWYAKLCWLLIR